MHLADAFIQSDLQYIQVIYFFFVNVCSLGIEPTTFAVLTQCSTTEPRQYVNICHSGITDLIMLYVIHLLLFRNVYILILLIVTLMK